MKKITLFLLVSKQNLLLNHDGVCARYFTENKGMLAFQHMEATASYNSAKVVKNWNQPMQYHLKGFKMSF